MAIVSAFAYHEIFPYMVLSIEGFILLEVCSLQLVASYINTLSWLLFIWTHTHRSVKKYIGNIFIFLFESLQSEL